MKSALEPCPFCGATPDDLIFDEGSTFRWLAWSCPGCGIGSEERVQTLGSGDPAQWLLDAKDRARAAWNNRTPIGASKEPQ